MRWGIIGMGYMAKKFANSLSKLNNTSLKGISSKSNFKLKKYGERFNIENKYRFNDYEEILKCNEIDNIYISTINNTHYEIVNKAITYKKNILCEKPMTTSYKNTQKIINLLKRSGVFFMEALPYTLHPQTSLIIKIIKENRIGNLCKITSSFGNDKSDKNNEHRLFNKDLGGGAILDLGCYPISFSNLVANINYKKNKPPKILNTKGIIVNKVDTEASITLKYENGLKSFIELSIKNNLENKTIIIGDKGKIIINNLWSPEEKSFIEIHENNRYYKLFVKSEYSLIENQINIINKLIINKKLQTNSEQISWANSLENAFVIDLWKENLEKTYEN